MEFFQTLGLLIADRWKARNYNEDVFPEVAGNALAELPPAEYVSLWDAAKWGLIADLLPHQEDLDAKFGDPPLSVYTGRNFRIEVLFWTQGVPAIHQHGFSGAFHVLHGSSIHNLWEFVPSEQVEIRLAIGRVSWERAEILSKGDTRLIQAGNRMFHSTYHLDRPSVSVVVRTLNEANRFPQYSLLPPTIAFAPLEEIPTVKRQVQLLLMLAIAGRRSELKEITRHLCATKDAYSVFMLLSSVFDAFEDEEEREDVLNTARHRHPTLIDALEPVLLRDEIGRKILNAHRAIDDAELKFFLALLRNVPDRATVLKLIEQRFPGRDCVATAVSWIGQLLQLIRPAIRLNDASLLVLQHLLVDSSSQDILRALQKSAAGASIPSTVVLERLCSALQNAWLLRPLCLKNPFSSAAASTAGDLEASTAANAVAAAISSA